MCSNLHVLCVSFWRRGRLSDPFSPAVRSFGTETPWDEMTHHNTVLMRDTHAGLAPVLKEIGSVNPNMHRHHTSRATDNMSVAERQRRGWEGGDEVEIGTQREKRWKETAQMHEQRGILGGFFSQTPGATTENKRLRKMISLSGP